MTSRLATVFGGSGFIGRHLVRRLAADGWRVRVAVRDPVAAEFLRTAGEVGQIVPMAADITSDASVAQAVEGAQAVINLVGILYERGAATFQAIHVEGARRVAAAAAAAGVERLVQVSALGAAADAPSDYARSKAAGEQAVQAAFPQATILRPSVVFGPEDGFFNRFANLARVSPVLPVFTRDGLKPKFTSEGMSVDYYGSGGPRFQPVYVGDVADAIMAVLRDAASAGRVYELGGPRSYTMREIMALVADATGRHRPLLPLPYAVGRLQAAVLKYMPTPALTPDQMRQLEVDNVVSGNLPGLEQLGISPTAVEPILPTYLARHRPPGDQVANRPPSSGA